MDSSTVNDFLLLLKQLQTDMSVMVLDVRTYRTITFELSAVAAEAADNAPSLAIIEGKLKSVESIFASKAQLRSAAPRIQRLISLAQQLFRGSP
jgi:hypothetical protein